LKQVIDLKRVFGLKRVIDLKQVIDLGGGNLCARFHHILY